MDKKIAIVTGSARGIGKSIALKLANENAKVLLVDASDGVNNTAEEFLSLGLDAQSYRLDITDAKAVEEFFADVFKQYGKIDIVVNNAGITKDGLMLRMSEEDWDAVLNVNLKGSFLFCKFAGKYMMKKRTGKIVNVASIVGVMGNAGQANYASSKAGVIGLTKSVAKELAGRGITCNAIAPGFIQTKMTDELTPEVKENYLSNIPLKRFGTTEEVAEVIKFLVSDSANYITGQVLHIDGGLVM